MALPITAETRDFANFADNGDSTTSRFVRINGGIGNLLSGLTFDAISATYPNSVTEVFAYKTGGLSGSVVATVTVIYTTSSKTDILSVEKS